MNQKSTKFYALICTLIFSMLVFVGCSKEPAVTETPTDETITVTDQLGKEVTIPKNVERVICLQHHTLDIILELQAGDKLVGILAQWPSMLGEGIADIYPRLNDLPTPGDLKTVNIEELTKLEPDVVFVTHYMAKETIEQIENMDIPVVAISLYEADYEEASKMNPDLKDPDKAYTEGFKTSVALIGKVLGKDAKAAELIAFAEKNRELIKERLADLPSRDKRVTCYMANPELNTYGTGKYTGVIMERAGGRNVAEEIAGYKQVTMEQVMLWNPDVIFVQGRYADVAEEILESSAWQEITAVKDDRVYTTPEYVKPWGHPCPESMALGELWMAKKLYPDKFADIDMQTIANDFYTSFYGIPYNGKH